MAWGDRPKSEEKVMSKFWLFVYRNANDNHIIAADESVRLRRLGTSFGTKAKELVESAPTERLASAHRTLAMEFRAFQEVAGQSRIYAIHFQYIGHWPHAPANMRFGQPIWELAEFQRRTGSVSGNGWTSSVEAMKE
ncbi:hypothetical protein TNCT_468631 [Trichonephila clavata]|uniref:Uncharacterized protein n=1 Tax=Trichonephila clavata TaxID=2740835 RepID=A0A8X6HQT9_TRICU|nr:hypothetical protein TNCT_468631 [Trichonephila clavata]